MIKFNRKVYKIDRGSVEVIRGLTANRRALTQLQGIYREGSLGSKQEEATMYWVRDTLHYIRLVITQHGEISGVIGPRRSGKIRPLSGAVTKVLSSTTSLKELRIMQQRISEVLSGVRYTLRRAKRFYPKRGSEPREEQILAGLIEKAIQVADKAQEETVKLI